MHSFEWTFPEKEAALKKKNAVPCGGRRCSSGFWLLASGCFLLRHAEQRIDRRLEVFLRSQAHELLGDLPLVEKDDRRDRGDAELHRGAAVGVRVHLADPRPALVLLGDFIDG